MSGEIFKKLREFNRISQIRFATYVGKSSRQFTGRLESQFEIPQRYIKALSELIGINLFEEKRLKSAIVSAEACLSQFDGDLKYEVNNFGSQPWQPDWNEVFHGRGILKYSELFRVINDIYPHISFEDIRRALKFAVTFSKIKVFHSFNQFEYCLKVS